jgi:hypothetical protein
LSFPDARRAAAVLATAALLGLPRAGGGFDLKLWPLLRYTHDPRTGELHWSALGPVLEYRRTAETRELRLRPLLWLRQRRGTQRDDRADVLYPLAGMRWQEDARTVRVLIFTYRRERVAAAPTAADEARARLTLFPFLFYRRSPEHGVRLSVLPFYLDQEDFLGYQRARGVMLPAFLELTEPRLVRRFYGFPFVSTLSGADGRGIGVLPFYGDKEILGRERRRYVLWPFHVRRERLVPGYGMERTRIDFPVYASIDGAGRRVRGWALGAYLHSVDERRGVEAIGAPWPVVYRERRLGEDRWRAWRVAPFYGYSDRDELSSRFYAWPAYRWRAQDVDGFHYERRDVGLLLWRRQTVRSDVSGKRERLTTVAALLRDEDRNGRRLGQVPALADSLLPRNRGVLALWAPLWALGEWDTAADGARDWSVLWGLVARQDRRLRGPWTLDLDEEAADGG